MCVLGRAGGRRRITRVGHFGLLNLLDELFNIGLHTVEVLHQNFLVLLHGQLNESGCHVSEFVQNMSAIKY